MGTPPTPPYATIYYGIHDEKLLPQCTQHIIFYCQFIDDVRIWCPNRSPQHDAMESNSFKQEMNTFPGLTWEFSNLSTTIDFMDMTITLKMRKIKLKLHYLRKN